MHYRNMNLLAILFSLSLNGFVFAQNHNQKKESVNPLVMTGEVTNLNLFDDKKYPKEVLLKVDLKLNIQNLSDENVIFLNGYKRCYTADVKFKNERLGHFYYPQSAFLPKQKEISKKLNKTIPPKELSKILIPNGTWDFDLSFGNSIPKKSDRITKTGFDEKGKPYTTITTRIPFGSLILEELEGKSPVYLFVECDFEPVWLEKRNKIYDGKDFFNKLGNKWKEFGDLWVGELISEPILFDISQANRTNLNKQNAHRK